ncbi:cysteine-rich CWC family protein [Pelobium manganitolerans]|uniref:cysteine-rich CWC family protein n=1 Tax=Pelobium manganitolerans TaxID=1842495 RepID=UPI001FE9FD7F|nr:cysteine-rich CWC family protein [Pelobium manganitolerans]
MEEEHTIGQGKYTKHEIIICERCHSKIECKANNYTQCQCSTVTLDLNEVQYVSEHFDGCLCAKCLTELKEEYRRLWLD